MAAARRGIVLVGLVFASGAAFSGNINQPSGRLQPQNLVGADVSGGLVFRKTLTESPAQLAVQQGLPTPAMGAGVPLISANPAEPGASLKTGVPTPEVSSPNRAGELVDAAVPSKRPLTVMVLDNLGVKEIDDLRRLERGMTIPATHGGSVFDGVMIHGALWAIRSIDVFGRQTPPVEQALEQASENGVEVRRHRPPMGGSTTVPNLLLDGKLAVRRDHEVEPPYPGAKPREYVLVSNDPLYVLAAREQIHQPLAAMLRRLRERASGLVQWGKRALRRRDTVTIVDPSGSMWESAIHPDDGLSERRRKELLDFHAQLEAGDSPK